MANKTLVASLLADYYSKGYEAWDTIVDLFAWFIWKHGDKKYFIYHTIIKEVGKMLKDNNNSFYCEINKTLMNFYLMIFMQI